MSSERRTAIVTGGDSGIGHAIALELGRRGMAVTVNYHKNQAAADATVKAIQSGGGTGQAVQGDVSSVDDIQALIDRTVEAFGRLDVIVNNAGMETRTSVLDTTEQQFDLVIAVDLKSAFFGVAAGGEADDLRRAAAVGSSTSRRSTRTGRCPATRRTAPRRAESGC